MTVPRLLEGVAVPVRDARAEVRPLLEARRPTERPAEVEATVPAGRSRPLDLEPRLLDV